MRIGEVCKTLSFRKKNPEKNQLFTVWGEAIRKDRNAPVLPEYPRPQMRRDQYCILNGIWNYGITKKTVEEPVWDGDILVPFSPECALSGVERQLAPDEWLWYERTVFISEEELAAKETRGKRLLLHFGAVDQSCLVWWNGAYMGSHHGGYLPFTFEVTEFVRPENTLRLQVWDDSDTSYHARGKQTLRPEGLFYTAQSGIWQTVWMEWVPACYIEELRLTPYFEERRVTAELIVRDGTCRKKIRRERSITEEEFHPWTPEDPYLYDWEIAEGEDRIRTYFAMRSFTVGEDEKGVARLFLNGRPYYQHGVLDQGYWPDGLMTAPSDEAFVFDIRTMKEAGFNLIRKHIKVEPLRWYYHCDRLGMLVWQDMVNGGGRYDLFKLAYLPTAVPYLRSHMKDHNYSIFSREELAGRKEWLAECRETVRHLYNCPCIGMWVPFNEGWGQFDAARVAEMIRGLDPTRLIDHASGWVDQGGGDVKSIHNYFHRLKVWPDRSGKRPVVYSEYGGYACYMKGHSYSNQIFGYRRFGTAEEFARAFGKLQEKMRELAQDGLCADVYTQVSDVEDEVNGLLTYDRKIYKLSGK